MTIAAIAPPASLDAHLGAKLREARIFRRMTQDELGQQLDVSYQQVQKYENGGNRMSAATLYRIGAALGVKPEWFFEGLDAYAEGEPPPRLDAQQLRLLAAFDRIAHRDIRNGLAAFIHALADGMALEARHAP